MTIKTYSDMIQLPTFEERYAYLRLNGRVAAGTFEWDRVFNQMFYRSSEWKDVRDYVIVRDNGCDLADPDCEIHGRIIVHHMNPIALDDINTASKILLDPEYLVCTTHKTHNAIHYGDERLISRNPIERTANDTCPWKLR